MSESDALREALVEWQHIASDLSDYIIRNGGHAVAKHEAPQQYDSMSSLACTTCALGGQMTDRLPVDRRRAPEDGYEYDEWLRRRRSLRDDGSRDRDRG